MIQSIWIQNFILIDHLRLDFTDGFSAFTGETGAGKSIVMDAIGYLCGARMNTSLIRHGKNKLTIEAEFTVNEKQKELLEEAGLDSDALIVTREFDQAGKSVCRINHRTVTLNLVRSVIGEVIDIHSQHDHQYLLDPKYHLLLLDQYVQQEALRDSLKDAYHAYQSAIKEYETLSQTTYSQTQVDYLSYQVNELEQAKLVVGEEEELEENIKRMSQYEKLYDKVNSSIEYLNADQGVLSQLYDAAHALESISDAKIEPIQEQLDAKYYELNDLLESLQDYLGSLTMDEQLLDEWNQRIFEIHRLKRKYNMSVEQMIAHVDQCKKELEMLEDREIILSRLEKKSKETYAAAFKLAQELSAIRKQQAQILSNQVQKELRDLQLPYARFEIQFSSKELSSDGIDDVCFMISMNPGESLRPLHKVASGGELSRLMLGLKTIFTRLKGVELVIFDEIDTGVSGSVALSIGEKMHEIAQSTQVFAVTHLAPVAGWADYHYHVSKQQDENLTTTEIHLLDESSRIKEMAWIANGQINESSLEAAKTLRNSILEKEKH